MAIFTIEQVAKMCHTINKQYCEKLGDNSQPSWEDAPDWQKESAVQGVKHILLNPDAKPWDSHKNWMKQKLNDGWTYGAKKDPEKKTHPCLVPYTDLPADQRVKDELFIECVKECKQQGIKTCSDYIVEEISDSDNYWQVSQFDELTGNRTLALKVDSADPKYTAEYVASALNFLLYAAIEKDEKEVDNG